MTDNRASLLHNRRQFLLFIATSAVVAPATRAWAQQLVASHDAIPAAAPMHASQERRPRSSR